jgi:hypothetical protein
MGQRAGEGRGEMRREGRTEEGGPPAAPSFTTLYKTLAIVLT